MNKGIWAAGIICAALVAGARAPVEPYEAEAKVEARSAIDRCLFRAWERAGIPVPYRASDTTFCRRAYLSLAGRLPTEDEAKAYFADTDAAKADKLVDRLLAGEGFVDYWTMKALDALRVKSEFPINLWPNAVYVYGRRIREAVRRNEPADAFARALLTSAGSNFRVPEVNFFRALADRTPRGIAAAVAQTFLGTDFSALPPGDQTNLAAFFAGVTYAPTKEWKEEIVFWKPFDETATLTLPDGSRRRAEAATDRRALFADYLLSGDCPAFARSMANRVWFGLFGEGLYENPDNILSACRNPELAELLARDFVASGYDLRALCREIAKSAVMRESAFVPAGDYEKARRAFAVYPIRRLDAEVLQDAIRDLTGTTFEYSSVIPEPFTFLPPKNRTVTLMDGSITSQFLILFGRPARDTGLLLERNNAVSAKQMLYLYNSGDVYRRLNRLFADPELRDAPPPEKADILYWRFYGRPTTLAEHRGFLDAYKSVKQPKLRWRSFKDLAWSLLSSKEFLYIN